MVHSQFSLKLRLCREVDFESTHYSDYLRHVLNLLKFFNCQGGINYLQFCKDQKENY